ncbi:MAG: hypothetical protein ACKVP4_04975 [Hyphomicrobium sp.]
MTPPRLVIRKRMQFIQGKTRPCCYVQAMVDDDVKAKIEEHFLAEALFKRAFYSNNWPEGAIQIPAALGPAMSQFLKNDACPEITIKTILAGQLHQGANVWEMMSFELIAKLAFDNFCALVVMATELDRDIIYPAGVAAGPAEIAVEDFDEDTMAELKALGAANLAA